MSDEDSILWEPPPPKQVQWKAKLAPFMERPGEWGKVPGDYHFTTCSHLKSGKLGGLSGKWEFASRKTQDHRRVVIYARYLGE